MNTLQLENGNYTFGIFDFDGNILNTKTPLIFRHKSDKNISSFSGPFVDQNKGLFYGAKSIYEEVKNTYYAFSDVVSDENHKGFDAMIDDVEVAIKSQDFSPSFSVFKNMYLIPARPFAILTARRNSPDNFQKAFLRINEVVLTETEKQEQYKNIIKNYKIDSSRVCALDYYFGKIATYIPCNNPHTEKFLHLQGLDTETKKSKSIDFLLQHYVFILETVFGKSVEDILQNGEHLSFGFSDDGLGNIISVYDTFLQIIKNNNFYPNTKKKLSVYFTGKKEDYHQLLSQIGGNFQSSEEDYCLKIKLKS